MLTKREQDVLDRIDDLAKRVGQLKKVITGALPADASRVIFRNADIQSWDTKLSLINRYRRDAGSEVCFLHALDIAVRHLQVKNHLLLANGQRAFSQLAAGISHCPLVKTLFSGTAADGRSQGLIKQEARSQQLGVYLGELESRHRLALFAARFGG